MFDGTLRFDTSIDNNGFKSGIGGLGKLADAKDCRKRTAIASTAMGNSRNCSTYKTY